MIKALLVEEVNTVKARLVEKPNTVGIPVAGGVGAVPGRKRWGAALVGWGGVRLHWRLI